MEHLARVHDGSEGKIVNGYWLCQAVALECGGNDLVPLANRLWSQNAPDLKRENNELLQCVDTVSAACGKPGIWFIKGKNYWLKISRARAYCLIATSL